MENNFLEKPHVFKLLREILAWRLGEVVSYSKQIAETEITADY